MVGAGIGGLSAAIHLARSGHDVTVLERGEVVGGKARAVHLNGRAIDSGPTVLTMREVFDALFEGAERFEQAVALERAELIARHFWQDGSQLDLFADRARTIDAIGDFAGKKEAANYASFAKTTEAIWSVAKDTFVLAQRPKWTDVLREVFVRGVSAVGQIDGHRTMWQALTATFDDPRLRQLFGRYATYCGGSPFEVPATYNLVAHVESCGVYRLRGGISSLAIAMADLAKQLGARIRVGCEVTRILTSKNHVQGVEIAGGERIDADIVVANTDVNALASKLRVPSHAVSSTTPSERSLSALTYALIAKNASTQLTHHTVAFANPSAYADELDSIFRHGRMCGQPTVYVCAQDRSASDEKTTADGVDAGERLLLVANAPATGDQPHKWTAEEIERCERAVFSTLDKCGLLRLQTTEIRARQRTTPVDFENAYPSTGGALYGARPRGPLSSLFREGARSKIAGLYLAGGSVHPGPGVPMAALSGQLCATSIRSDLDSTARSRRVGINGITSMA